MCHMLHGYVESHTIMSDSISISAIIVIAITINTTVSTILSVVFAVMTVVFFGIVVPFKHSTA